MSYISDMLSFRTVTCEECYYSYPFKSSNILKCPDCGNIEEYTGYNMILFDRVKLKSYILESNTFQKIEALLDYWQVELDHDQIGKLDISNDYGLENLFQLQY